ncbi:LOB domain-containing protein 22-like [Gastrolobium bilobum]|uniref:LOB domain-containing protein 22-like n=1 Tax=Gastrolobium bilobum TaxID=150636 RepID=UPI002AAF7C87|nr:LOB domain-containing protein 22-like [Gastrolobium bilobum]
MNRNNINNNNTISRNGNNSTTQACAACKYQRRKCAPDCILAPYFPHDRQRQFLNAHKLFGVSSITKIIKDLDPHDKDQAMRTIIYQSDMRASDPVGGCYRYIQDLQANIEYYRAELELVLQQLAIFRAQAQQQHQHHVYGTTTAAININNVDDVMNADPLSLYNSSAHYSYLQQMTQQEQYIMAHETNENNINNNNNTPLQEHVNTWAMQNSMSLSSLSLQGQTSNASDEYDHKPMLDIPSDERSELGFESEELIHRSDEAVLFKIDDAVIKGEADCIQQSQDHDLKGAATLFTLTNCSS